MDPDSVREAVRAFYDLHPYPPPVKDLEADFHLIWPGKTYRENLKVLVAGCGASQVAKHALRQPASQVVGINPARNARTGWHRRVFSGEHAAT
jgi:hypothetical protein